MLVVALYYSRITLACLVELLDLPVEEARPEFKSPDLLPQAKQIVLVVAKHYLRITLARLAELLDLPVEEARPDPLNLTTLGYLFTPTMQRRFARSGDACQWGRPFAALACDEAGVA